MNIKCALDDAFIVHQKDAGLACCWPVFTPYHPLYLQCPIGMIPEYKAYNALNTKHTMSMSWPLQFTTPPKKEKNTFHLYIKSIWDPVWSYFYPPFFFQTLKSWEEEPFIFSNTRVPSTLNMCHGNLTWTSCVWT